jgi:hypothetical protein
LSNEDLWEITKQEPVTAQIRKKEMVLDWTHLKKTRRINRESGSMKMWRRSVE